MRAVLLGVLLASLIFPQDFMRVVRRGPPPAGGGGGGGCTPATPVFKALISGEPAGSSTTVATSSGTLNVAACDSYVVLIGRAYTSPQTTSVTCGGESLTNVAYNTPTGEGYRIELWVKSGAAANGTASCTATFSVSADFRVIFAATYSGLVDTSVVDQSSCSISGCATVSSLTTSRTAADVTTTVANTLLIGLGVNYDAPTTLTGAGSFTARSSSSSVLYWADRVVTATGTYPSGNFGTTSASERYLGFFAALKYQ